VVVAPTCKLPSTSHYPAPSDPPERYWPCRAPPFIFFNDVDWAVAENGFQGDLRNVPRGGRHLHNLCLSSLLLIFLAAMFSQRRDTCQAQNNFLRLNKFPLINATWWGGLKKECEPARRSIVAVRQRGGARMKPVWYLEAIAPSFK
jgi:hypothetical protein